MSAISNNLNTKIRLKLHFRLLVLFFIFSYTLGFSSEKTNNTSIYSWVAQNPDSIPAKDSTKKTKNKPFEEPIFSNAKDSTVYSLDGKKVFMYGDATVTYQNIELKAQYIEFDMGKKEVFAKGLADSTGKNAGRPIFKEGSQTYTMEDIYYNFNSKKAKINGVVTEQDGGFMHSEITKKMGDNTVNISNGKFTTCDQLHPHYYIAITKGKVIPNSKIISGPAYLVIEDVPLPLGIPFGFFPNSRNRASGVILPEYGEEARRGVYLRGGGFYFGINDNIDLKLTGDIYSFGSWLLRTQSTYKKRYKFSGSFDVNFSKIKADEYDASSYSIHWSHSQDAKASPNSTFSANVNFESTNNNKYNAQSIETFLNNSINSSISYSRNFIGTPFRFSSSLTHSQNNQTKIINLNFPALNFSMDQIYPFKRESNIGAPSWYEKIGFKLNSTLNNSVSVLENDLFKRTVFSKMKNGVKHEIPLSTSFNILKFITVSPSVNYSEWWTIKTIRRHWNSADSTVVEDTIAGFRRGWQYSTGASMSTKIYGMLNFGKDKAIQAIRHVITPSISFNYSPDFSDPGYGFYKIYQSDPTGNKFTKYSIFERGLGGPSMGKSGSIGFSLGNNLEMKVRSSKDTVNNFKKIKIFESLNFSSSYNLLADSMKLSPISFSGNTKLFDKLSVNFSGLLNPYSLNSAGTNRIDQFEFKHSGKPFYLTSASIGFDFSLNSSKKDKNATNQPPQQGLPPGANPNDPEFGQSMNSNFASPKTVDFNIPWNLSVRYYFTYSKPLLEKKTSQTLGFSGDFSLTPKWKIGFSSNYDFKSQKLTTTSINIYRDLHCWEMRMTVIPLGIYKSYSFQINVKSGMLQDLKWKKRDSYLDNAN